jgi:hypothetical protein
VILAPEDAVNGVDQISTTADDDGECEACTI